MHMCVCVWWSHRWRGELGQREAREGVLGSHRGLCLFFFSLSAGFGGLSLPVFFALPLSWWFTKFCIVNSWPLHRRLLGGEAGMGLTERRAMSAAGISMWYWSPAAFQGRRYPVYLTRLAAGLFFSNSPLQRTPSTDVSIAGWDLSPSHPCFPLLPPSGLSQWIQCSICEYCAEGLFSFSALMQRVAVLGLLRCCWKIHQPTAVQLAAWGLWEGARGLL